MDAKPREVVASILTLACVLSFLLASTLVPVADQQVWLWIGLATAGASALAWASALRSRSEQERRSIRP